MIHDESRVHALTLKKVSNLFSTCRISNVTEAKDSNQKTISFLMRALDDVCSRWTLARHQDKKTICNYSELDCMKQCIQTRSRSRMMISPASSGDGSWYEAVRTQADAS